MPSLSRAQDATCLMSSFKRSGTSYGQDQGSSLSVSQEVEELAMGSDLESNARIRGHCFVNRCPSRT